MEKALFDDLVHSLKEAKAIAAGRVPASRRFRLDALDVKRVRERTGLSQSDFAQLMHVSLKTLQNWENRRHKPTGPAVVLLKIVAKSPDVLLQALHA